MSEMGQILWGGGSFPLVLLLSLSQQYFSCRFRPAHKSLCPGGTGLSVNKNRCLMHFLNQGIELQHIQLHIRIPQLYCPHSFLGEQPGYILLLTCLLSLAAQNSARFWLRYG